MDMKRKYYAVAVGAEPGIYETWADCERQVKGFKGTKFKSFRTKAEAEEYLSLERSLRGSTSGVADKSTFAANSSVFAAKSSTEGVKAFQSKNPFREYSHQSTSVLDMAPGDYDFRVKPNGQTPTGGSASLLESPKAPPSTHLSADMQTVSDGNVLYQVEYDGASKGNPGIAGAGALLRHPDGTVVREVIVGLGKTTNNVAEYRGLIAGMRAALDLGISRIQIQGDSKLVTMQVRGKWKINHPHLEILCKEAVALLKNFKEFQIRHVDREYNSAADALANRGVYLPEEKFVSSFPPTA